MTTNSILPGQCRCCTGAFRETREHTDSRGSHGLLSMGTVYDYSLSLNTNKFPSHSMEKVASKHFRQQQLKNAIPLSVFQMRRWSSPELVRFRAMVRFKARTVKAIAISSSATDKFCSPKDYKVNKQKTKKWKQKKKWKLFFTDCETEAYSSEFFFVPCILLPRPKSQSRKTLNFFLKSFIAVYHKFLKSVRASETVITKNDTSGRLADRIDVISMGASSGSKIVSTTTWPTAAVLATSKKNGRSSDSGKTQPEVSFA